MPSEKEEESVGLTTGPSWHKDPDSRRLIIMLSMVSTVCVVELVAGVAVESLALLSDAFHMFSDALSLVVGFTARRLSQRATSKEMTYGWGRTEILGGLMNGVFLLSASFFILLESFERFIEPPEIRSGPIVLGVGGLGLLVNIVGLAMFRGHAHGHDHGHHHHEPEATIRPLGYLPEGAEENAVATNLDEEVDEDDELPNASEGRVSVSVPMDVGVAPVSARAPHDHHHSVHPKPKKHLNLNLHGVFIHILGDFLGSIGVMISGSFITFATFPNRFLADPIVSVCIALLIFRAAAPLVRRCASILVQRVPTFIDANVMRAELASISDSILGIHDLHIWQLVDNKIICSVHVTAVEGCNFMELAKTMKSRLHAHGIHSSTIQPEFVSSSQDDRSLLCQLQCATHCDNEIDQCCPTPHPPRAVKPAQETETELSVRAPPDVRTLPNMSPSSTPQL